MTDDLFNGYVDWFDDDQHRRGMTDYHSDELWEWADQQAEKAPLPALQPVARVIELFTDAASDRNDDPYWPEAA